jgi:RNA polymerase sigma factor (sigma-70 family)
MHEVLDSTTGLLNSQILDMSFGQKVDTGEKWKQTYPFIKEVLLTCTERDQNIFSLIFNDNITYRQIAKQYNISAARVGQIKDKIIHKIQLKIVQAH